MIKLRRLLGRAFSWDEVDDNFQELDQRIPPDDADHRFTTDAEKAIWNAKQAALGFTPVDAAVVGAAGGVAPLDGGGRIPAANLPSYVDDVLDFANFAAFPLVGAQGLIYIADDTNKQYRWTGAAYAMLNELLDVANEITASAAKASPVLADIFAILDSAAGFVLKKCTLTSLYTLFFGALTVPAGADTLVARATTDTLTNKRLTARLGSVASAAQPAINTDNVDIFRITAQLVAITSMSANLTGAPAHGDPLCVEITGTATRAITWGASFEASQVPLPTTTSGTDMLQTFFSWNSATNKWRCVGTC